MKTKTKSSKEAKTPNPVAKRTPKREAASSSGRPKDIGKPIIENSAPVRAIVSVQVDQIDPDLNQPRKYFDTTDIEETLEVDSDGRAINGHGIIEPLLVRPQRDSARVTIIDGERRWRSAKAKGLQSIDCIIRDVPKDQIRRMQLIAGRTGAPLRPLEAAEAVRLEQEENPHLSTRQLAARLGFSERRVRQGITLCSLAPAVRKALDEETITITLALELATIATHEAQTKALDEVRHIQLGTAKLHIRSRYHLRLAGGSALVGFDVADATLPGGSCEACPKNTAIQRRLWLDGKDEDEALCTDRVCFEGKRAATWERTKEAASAAGAKVVEGEAAKAIYPSAYISRPANEDVIDLDQGCDFDIQDDRPVRTWRDLLGPDAQPSIVAQDQAGRAHALVTLREAAEQLRAGGHEQLADEAAKMATEVEESRNKRPGVPARREDSELEQKANEEAFAEAIDLIVQDVGTREGLSVWRFMTSLLIRDFAESGDRDVLERASVRRDQYAPKRDEGWDPGVSLLEWLQEVTEEGAARGLAVELVIGRAGYDATAHGVFEIGCRYAGVDFEQLCRKHREAAGLGAEKDQDSADDGAERNDDEDVDHDERQRPIAAARPWSPSPVEARILAVCTGKPRSRAQIVAGCMDYPRVDVQDAIDRLASAERLATAGEGTKAKFATIVKAAATAEEEGDWEEDLEEDYLDATEPEDDDIPF